MMPTPFDIETEIARIVESSKMFDKLDLSKSDPKIVRPACSIAAVSAEISAQAGRLVQELGIVAVVAVRNANRDETARRMEAHPRVQFLIGRLWGETLGGMVSTVTPVSWSEITTEADMVNGLSFFQVRFKTRLVLKKMGASDTVELSGMDIDYNKENIPGPPQAADIIRM